MISLMQQHSDPVLMVRSGTKFYFDIFFQKISRFSKKKKKKNTHTKKVSIKKNFQEYLKQIFCFVLWTTKFKAQSLCCLLNKQVYFHLIHCTTHKVKTSFLLNSMQFSLYSVGIVYLKHMATDRIKMKPSCSKYISSHYLFPCTQL